MVAPYNKFLVVAKSDTVNFADGLSEAIYIGVPSTGTMSVVEENGNVTQFTGVAAGMLLPLRVKRINNTGTAASAFVVCYRV